MGESDPYPRSSTQPRSSDKSQADSLTSPTFAIHVAYFEGSFPASAPSGLSASAASKNRGMDLCSAIDCKASTSLSQQDSGTMSVPLKLDLPHDPNILQLYFSTF